MRSKALVFIGKQHVEETRIDIGDGRRQPPAAIGGGIGAQQPAVTIEHPRREFEVFAHRDRTKPDDPAKRTSQNRKAGGRYDKDRNATIMVPDPHGKDGKRSVDVKLGLSNGSRIEVLSGLKAGDTVVLQQTS